MGSRRQLSLLVLVAFLDLHRRVQSLQQPLVGSESESRRGAIQGFLTAAASALLAPPAFADSKADIQKLEQGYSRLNYLIDNWEKETTVCGQSDNPYIGLCERTPIRVMEYMGYKSTTDPLFQAEKTMLKLEPLVPSDKTSDYIDAVERFSQAAQESSDLAYVSSWAENNPGGGKDRVVLWIERAKKNVVEARDSLKVVVDILNQ